MHFWFGLRATEFDIDISAVSAFPLRSVAYYVWFFVINDISSCRLLVQADKISGGGEGPHPSTACVSALRTSWSSREEKFPCVVSVISELRVYWFWQYLNALAGMVFAVWIRLAGSG